MDRAAGGRRRQRVRLSGPASARRKPVWWIGAILKSRSFHEKPICWKYHGNPIRTLADTIRAEPRAMRYYPNGQDRHETATG